jgi:tetratricopeptide (TPR) repeat protein
MLNSERARGVFYPALLVASTFVSFWPTLGNGLLQWDDRQNILENSHLRSWSLDNVRWFWTTFHMGPYQPLSWMSLALDYRFWGLHPGGYHGTNLALHAAAALLLYAVLLRITRSSFGAFIGAMIFAIHPLRVESVAWATERRDVLSGLFFMAAWLAFLRRSFTGTFVFFVAAALSKATAVGLIWLLILTDLLVPETDQRTRISPRWPFFLAGGLIWFVGWSGARQEGLFVHTYSLLERAGLFVYAATFYIQKTLFPWLLSPLYGLPQRLSSLTLEFLVRAIAFASFTFWLFRRRRRDPLPAWAWAASLLILLPVSGVAQNGRQLVADRYTYLAGVPWAWVMASKFPDRRFWRFAVVPILLILMGLTWRQCRFWKSDRVLWERAIAVEPANRTAHYNLGTLQMGSDPEAARREFQTVLMLDPADRDAHYNAAMLDQAAGRLFSSARHYRECLRLKPDWIQAMNNLGLVLMAMKDYSGAMRELNRALAIDGHFAEARFNRGVLLFVRGNRREGQKDLALAVEERPDLRSRLATLGSIR